MPAKSLQAQVQANKKYRARLRAEKVTSAKQLFLQQYPAWDRIKQILKPHYREILEYRFGFRLQDKIPSYEDIGKILGISKQCTYEYYSKALQELGEISNNLDKYSKFLDFDKIE